MSYWVYVTLSCHNWKRNDFHYSGAYLFTSFVYCTNVYWSVIHGIKRKPHLSVVWNWYHFVAIAILHQPRPTDSADINTRLQLSDTSSIPPMHGGFLLVSRSVCPLNLDDANLQTVFHDYIGCRHRPQRVQTYCEVTWNPIWVHFNGVCRGIFRTSRATVPLLRYAPLTWQSGIECRLSPWNIFVNSYAWWKRDESKTYLEFQDQKAVL